MSFSEKRRFPRVNVASSVTALSSILGAQLAWPNHELSQVSDISYKGVAVRRPGLFPITVHEWVAVELKLGSRPQFKVKARVAWSSLDLVGLELDALPAEGHAAMTEYLDAQLLGSSLKPVQERLFAPDQTFQRWFQGPGGTHVFVWLGSDARVERVNVDLGHKVLEFTRGRVPDAGNADERRALLVLAQMNQRDLPMEEFLRSSGAS